MCEARTGSVCHGQDHSMPLLRELRESLGFSVDEVAAEAAWPKLRLRQIETSDEPETFEADRLSDLYGTDVEAVLSEGGIPPHPVSALLKGNVTTLDAGSRFRIAEATAIAKSVRSLQREVGKDSRWAQVKRFKSNSDYSHPTLGTPESLARRVRQGLGLGDGPIRSVADDLLAPLGVLVLWERLPSEVDAFSFANEDCGAVVVANVAGHHMGSAFGRRFTFAHEVCHVLFDRTQMRDMRRFCEVTQPLRRPRKPEEDTEYTIERRARAFAAYLLAPPSDLAEFWAAQKGTARGHRVRAVMAHYGIGYQAALSHLHNQKLVALQAEEPGIPVEPPAEVEAADPWPYEDETRARLGVPLPRAGALFRAVANAHREGILSDEGARDLLRVGVNEWARVRPWLGSTPALRPWRTSAARISEWL